jgi:hypothetical protein
MKYELKTVCPECPFRKVYRRSYSIKRLEQLASGEFPCHKTCVTQEDDEGQGELVEKPDGQSQACAGAMIYLLKRGRPHQMMRIVERLGLFDPSQLDLNADVR